MEKIKEWWLKRKRRILLLMVVAVLFGLFVVLNKPKLYGPYYVKYVYDGDTIQVDLDGEDVKIRLIGIDTPELEVDGLENPEGLKAKEYTESLVLHKKVYLQYDKEKTDKYGRTLAYVYLNEKTMVNKLILSSGNAVTMKIKPNTKYSIDFWFISILNFLFLE